MIIDALTALPSNPTAGDELPIERGTATYKVDYDKFVPTPLVIDITSGQWSGSGNDYYYTVSASNVTANSILVPNYDNASAAYLKGPVWCVPAAGSFTIHTSAIPSGTVKIMVQFPGIMGEANYQVLSDVYSKSQAVAKADIVNDLTSTSTTAPLSANMGKALNEAIAQSTAKSTSSADVQIYTGNITAYVNKLLKCNGLVYVFIEVETTSGTTLNTSNAFARIPSGWRPKVTEEFPASILQSNDIWATYKVSIDTNGGITQHLTNSAKGVSFVAVYEHA